MQPHRENANVCAHPPPAIAGEDESAYDEKVQTNDRAATASANAKLSDAAFKARFEAEKMAQQARHGAAFAPRRNCASKRCARHKACRDDPAACLRRAIIAVPHATQWQVRQKILADTARNIGAPERAARLLMPLDLCAETGAAALARYLAYR